jgi:adenylate kinase family enzyme
MRRRSGGPGELNRIHVFGASGSGCTTLGKALGERLGIVHLEADDVLWLTTEPPFSTVRELADRHAMLAEMISRHESWTLSGSLCGWGDLIIPSITLAVFVSIPKELRMQRLARRERDRFGDAIAPEGPRESQYRAFMEWAARYDDGDVSVRSRALHESWLAQLPCPALRLEGDLSTEERLARTLASLNA